MHAHVIQTVIGLVLAGLMPESQGANSIAPPLAGAVRASDVRIEVITPFSVSDAAAIATIGHELQHAVEVVRNGEDWKVTINVTPGRPVRLSEVSVSVTGPGKDERAIIEILEAKVLKPGLRLNHGTYELVKGSLVRAAKNDGYLEAKLTKNDLLIDREARRATRRETQRAVPRVGAFHGALRLHGGSGLQDRHGTRERGSEGQQFPPARRPRPGRNLHHLQYGSVFETEGRQRHDASAGNAGPFHERGRPRG